MLKIITAASNASNCHVDGSPFEVIINLTEGALGELRRLRQVLIDNNLKSVSIEQSRNDTLKLMSINWISEFVEGEIGNALSCNTDKDIEELLHKLSQVQDVSFEDVIFTIEQDSFTLSTKPLGTNDFGYSRTLDIHFKEVCSSFDKGIITILH